MSRGLHGPGGKGAIRPHQEKKDHDHCAQRYAATNDSSTKSADADKVDVFGQIQRTGVFIALSRAAPLSGADTVHN